ncbi:hypothetical protein DL771_004055 [Monosporascus sp. 5C6A]|nr:hypothetical protein DL771_004055 [Monosporascus sp. 5C6A]
MTAPSPPEKAFGLEFEFLVHVDLIGWTEKQKARLSRRPKNEQVYLIAKVIEEYLEGLGLGDPVEASNGLRIANNSRSENEDKCIAWIVKRDGSVKADGISVHSAYFNYACGLHVHVGLGDKIIPLLACQKLYSLLFLGVTPSEDPPDLTGSVLGDGFKHRFPDDDGSGEERAALDRLWRATDIDKFCDLVEGGPGGRLAYWFSHLRYEDQVMVKATIEFRKAEGNLNRPGNLDLVRTWPQVCTTLVAFAMDSGPAEFRELSELFVLVQ